MTEEKIEGWEFDRMCDSLDCEICPFREGPEDSCFELWKKFEEWNKHPGLKRENPATLMTLLTEWADKTQAWDWSDVDGECSGDDNWEDVAWRSLQGDQRLEFVNWLIEEKINNGQ